jgi:hypothetical protein
MINRVSSAESNRVARRFCAVFVLVFAFLLALVAVANYVVNPLAQYPPTMFRPVVVTSRAEKLRLFAALPAAPEALILGSSRVLKLEPKYVALKTGLTCFNAGVNYAHPEDHLAWFRHYVAVHRRAPRLVLVGLDISSFSDHAAPDAELLGNPQLLLLIRDVVPFRDRWQRWVDLVSWQQTRQSLRSLLIHGVAGQFPESQEYYEPDGLLVYARREREIAAGTYDFAGALRSNQIEYEMKFADFSRLAPGRLEIFNRFVQSCGAHGTNLVVFLTPMHPALAAHLAARTDYEARKCELLAFLRRRSRAAGFHVVDASELPSFHGDPHAFVDGIHPLEANTRRIVDLILDDLPGDSEYAVQ